MARPLNEQVLQSVTTTETSQQINTKGHVRYTVFASGEDLTNLTSLSITLEGSPNGDVWSTVRRDVGNDIVITETDLNENDNASLSSTGAFEYLRVSIDDFTADSGSINVWIMVSGNSGPGKRGTGELGQ